MRKLAGVVGLAAMLALPVMAAEDLTGTWTGAFNITMDGQTNPDVVHMVLKQEEAKLTGTAGPSAEEQWPIANGKIDGNKVTFQVLHDEATVDFTLTLAEGHLKGDATAEGDGMMFYAAVDVQRKMN